MDSLPASAPLENTSPGANPRTRMALGSGLLVTLAAVSSALGLVAAVHSLTPTPVRVEVDLSVSAGSTVALFVNDLARTPFMLPVVPGERHKYVFNGIVEDITMLRVDPTDAAGASLQFHAITIVGRDGILAQFGPQALAGWTTSAVSVTRVDDTALSLLTTSNDPILTTSVSIPVVRSGGAWTRWLPMVNAPDISWRLAAAGLTLLVVVASFDSARRLHVVLALAATGLVVAVLAAVAQIPDRPASAAVAVSRATFVGLSTRPALLASIILAVGAVLIGAAAARIDRRRSLPVEGSSPRMRPWQAVVGILLIGLVTSPDLYSWATVASTRQYTPHWDSDNLTYWAYLLQHGRLPMRDFWHPYAGMAVFDLPFPTGPALRWLYNFLLFSLVFLAFGKWRGASAAFLATSLLLAGQRFGLFPGMERYLLALVVVVAYVSGNRGGSPASAKVLFWCACALTLFIEPPQLVYAAVPIGAILAVQAIARWRSEPGFVWWLERRLLIDFGVPLLLTLGACGLLALSGQLGGFVEMYTRLGDAVAYSTWPTGLPESLPTGFPRAETVLVCSIVLMTIGVYEYGIGGTRRIYGEALVGIGLVTLIVLQKHFMRWMDEQLVLFVAVSMLVLAVGWPGRRRVIECIAGGALVGAFAATAAVKPGAASTLAFLAQSPSRATAALAFLATDTSVAGPVKAAQFAPARFATYVAERSAVEAIRAHAGPGNDVGVFALTDEMAVYILTGQRFTWISNMYDASPIYRQERVVRWLETEQPPYVVFRTDHLMFDGFQMLVRVPLVFSEVISTYVPLDVDGRMQILRRRATAEPIAMSYWRERLGSDVNIGRLASVSSFAEGTDCTEACGDLLIVRLPPGESGRVTIPMTANGLPFSLSFTRVADETTYRVLLDRVWFWNVAKRAGLPHALVAPDQPGPHQEVRVVRTANGTLY